MNEALDDKYCIKDSALKHENKKITTCIESKRYSSCKESGKGKQQMIFLKRFDMILMEIKNAL